MSAMPPAGRHASRARDHIPFWLAVVVTLTGLVVLVTTAGDAFGGSSGVAPTSPASIQTPAPANTTFPGLTTFRGNDSRSYYGEGPVPSAPVIRWKYPNDGTKLCANSREGLNNSPLEHWCGTGWTGQPNVVPWNGGMQIRIGAFDDNYHFLDAGSGQEDYPPLMTGDLAKGSATTDPDGYPLYYAGSRDNNFRIVAMDRRQPTVLWSMNAHTSVPRPIWNDDWDGAALVVGDYLLEGGENSWFYVVRLNRGYDAQGKVTVDPKIVARIPGWDQQLLQNIVQPGGMIDGLDERYDISIENSVAYRDGVVYFANSGGLVQGWDISDLLNGGTHYQRVFRFWTGDDTDASIVIDDQGDLYVASEFQRFNAQAREVGQLMKLDPSKPNDPLVWSIPATEIGFEAAGGSWSTPALYGDYVYFATAAGRVLEVNRQTGQIVWQLQIASPSIVSPVVVDGTLLQGDCSGHLYAWNVSDPTVPPPLEWNLNLGNCVESTPAVWHGWLYVGTREGYIYGIADKGTPAPTS
jgi:outer membrane protein assembly factor BamB